MTESVSSSRSIMLQALSDLKAYRNYRKTANNSVKTDNTEEQDKENTSTPVSRKALSDIMSRRSETENRSEAKYSEHNIRNMRNPENKSAFMTEENMPTDRPSSFLPEEMMGNNSQSVFLTEENMPTNRPSPFLSEDMIPSDHSSPFLSDEIFSQGRVAYSEMSETSTERTERTPQKTQFKSSFQITSELRNNAKFATMTPFDIAREYKIPLRQAEDIYMMLNADKNGIVKELKLPENSTVSYKV